MSKFKDAKNKIANKMQPVIGSVAGAVTTAAVSAQYTFLNAFAEGDPVDNTQSNVIDSLKDVGGKVCLALAAVVAIVGIITFARAQTDANGPEKSKAIGELGGAVALAAVGVLLPTLSF